jgi:hypothetical protein
MSAQRAVHIAERKRIYEAIHGPAKAIGAKASNAAQGKGDANENSSFASSFTADTAAKTGRTRRSVQIEAKRGEEIGAAELSKVVGTLISNS